MNCQILRLTESHLWYFEQLIGVFEDVFEMKQYRRPGKEFLMGCLQQPGFYVFVALNEGQQVVGGLTAYTLRQYYSERPLVYIYDLAVNRDIQRSGVGTRLIAAIKESCLENGVEEIFVQADRIDEHAVSFYRRTGATEENVLHFYYPLHSLS